jgi:K+-transporting ATPase KdpF subunit
MRSGGLKQTSIMTKIVFIISLYTDGEYLQNPYKFCCKFVSQINPAMNASIILVLSKPAATDLYSGYIIGAIIALFILGYLIFTLIKPEKF